MRVTQLVYRLLQACARDVSVVLGLSLLTLSKTESEITCPEGSEVEGKYGHLWYGRLTLHVARRIAVWAEGDCGR